jgi:hypothetical protein
MTQTAEATLDRDTVEAVFNYTVDTGIKPVNETYGPSGLMRRESGQMANHTMTVHDGRAVRDQLSLDVSGFELVEAPTKVTDYFDTDQLKAICYPETEALIKARSGATRVVIFDYTLRAADEKMRERRKIREPVKAVHNDYTEWSGPQRLRDILPDEAEELLKRRFAIIQVWRPINRPVQTDPFALADARSLEAKDFIAAERRHPDRVGEIYQFSYSPNHRWYYFPRMTRDETIVFKVYDSAKDGRARWTAHSSFDDPNTPPGAPPRESIELRALAFFDA